MRRYLFLFLINATFLTSVCPYGIRFLYSHGHSFCPYSLMRVSKVRAATCLSAPRSSCNLITERARSMILCSHGCHCLIQFSASPAVRVSLRQSILHGLSRQHTAIGQKILFVILIGFPSLLLGFSLFRILTHRSITGHTSAMLTLSLHRSPCSCPAHVYLPHTFLWCHLCGEGKDLLSQTFSHALSLSAFPPRTCHVLCNPAPLVQNIG